MNITELTENAMIVRNLYSKLEQQQYNKNWTTTQIMEGFVGDVGDLMKLVMAKDGIRETDNLDAKLKHELADCLWSILVLAKEYNIDLESEFTKTMNELEKKINKKLL